MGLVWVGDLHLLRVLYQKENLLGFGFAGSQRWGAALERLFSPSVAFLQNLEEPQGTAATFHALPCQN